MPQKLLQAAPFTFVVTADMRNFSGTGVYDTSDYFRGVCEAIDAISSPEFMIIPGDLDPPADVKWTLDQYLGIPMYPCVGNHESETADDMTWLRNYNAGGNSLPHIVNIGPSGSEETTYAFDYENIHFVVLNQYYDGTSDTGTDGDMVDDLYDWLEADLASTTKQHIIVIGHEPAFPQADMDNGRSRHVGDCLDQYPSNRDRFWALLKREGVLIYCCGHTHNTSLIQADGIWQMDVGHARGAGDLHAPGTFVLFHVDGDTIAFEIYRDIHDDYNYEDIVHTGYLNTVYSETLVSSGSEWRYLDNGSDQGTSWRTSAFDDAGWNSGNAQLGYGDGDETTVVSYGPDANNKYITTYFRHTWSISDIDDLAHLKLGLLRDDGAIVYMNGMESYRSNITMGSVTYTTLANAVIGGSDESLFNTAIFSADMLTTGSNVLSTEVHQISPTSSDISLDCSLEAWSFVLPVLKIKAILEAAYDTDGDTMRTTLQDSTLLPLTSPYAEDQVTLSQIPSAAVDWILLELRSSPSGDAVASKSLFLRKDCFLMDSSSNKKISFDVSDGTYYVVLKHRNHLRLMSTVPLTMNRGSISVYDFSSDGSQAYGNCGMKEVESGIFCISGGDVNQDGEITTADYASWYNAIVNGISGYNNNDCNLDTQITPLDYTFWQTNAMAGAVSGVP